MEARKRNPQLRIVVVLDAMRGSRSDSAVDPINTTSVSLLKPLLASEVDSQQLQTNGGVYFYHAPAVSGIWERMLPPRWNELPGVHHIKTYLFDDDIVRCFVKVFVNANLNVFFIIAVVRSQSL